MTSFTHRALRSRLIEEFADDPKTVAEVTSARGAVDIVAALAETYAKYMDLLRTFGRARDNMGESVRHEIGHAAEKRETALLDIMRFFELTEVRGRTIVVRREGDTGLSIQYRAAASFVEKA